MAKTSAAARERRKAKRRQKGGKAGCQGHFHGERASFIDENFEAYLDAKNAPRQAAETDFWVAFFARWWARFQWNLPLDCDPDPSFPPPPAETPEILKQKAEIIKITQKVRIYSLNLISYD